MADTPISHEAIGAAKPRLVWLTSGEAASRLGVERATLYAYVSRGLVRSQPAPGPSRARRYAREDVERLRRRTEERRHPDKAAARALQWGLPVLESAITCIDGARLYYRGRDALALAESAPVAGLAALIWTGRPEDAATWPAPRAAAAPPADRSLPFIPRAQSALARAAARDGRAFDLRPDAVARTGWHILHLMTSTASEMKSPAALPIERALARAWGVDARGEDALRAALILCADHELNVSAFTARCVASAGAHPYAAVIAGLAALEGTRHGGASARVEAMLESLHRARPLSRAIADRLRRGETVDGFGHPLYPEGDPRATTLLALLRTRFGRTAELRFVMEVAAAAGAALRDRPNVDFALAALARVLRLPAGAPLMLFAIGRTIGWIGHAIEQYATGQLIRPRARYVGPAALRA
jgi:citrate synthase